MKFRAPARILATALLLIVSSSAAAHPFHPISPGFVAGFVHPFAGLDHLLAMVAVGLWSAQFGGRWLWTIPLTFIAAMLAGGVLGFAGLTLPLQEPMIAASVLMLGLLIVLRIHLRTAGLLLVAGFALFHGIAHGAELPATATPLPYAAGFVLTTALLHLLGLAAGLQARTAVRLLGAPIALAGGLLLLNTMA